MSRGEVKKVVEVGYQIILETVKYVPFGSEISEALSLVGVVVKTVANIVAIMEGNDQTRSQILSAVQDLELIHRELNQLLQQGQFPESSFYGLKKLRDSLEVCKVTCEYIQNQSGFKKLVRSIFFQKKLEKVKKELKNTKEYLQLALQLGIMYKQNENNKTFHIGINEIKTMVSNPQGGAYLNPDEHTDLLPPNQPSVRLSSTTKGMIVTWIDRENKKNNVLYYEVMLDSDTEQIFPFSVEKLHSQKMEKNETNNDAYEEISVPDIEKLLPPLKYSVCFCHPTVNEGQLYEVKVRAVNGVGPSDWSEEFLFRYKSGYPRQPQISAITATGPQTVKVQFKVCQTEDNAINECLIEYTDVNNSEATSWVVKEYKISQLRCTENNTSDNSMEKYYTRTIEELEQFTRYRFKVAVKNGIRQSLWSKCNEVLSDPFLPGCPRDFKISERNKTSIVLCWKEPKENPSGVHNYRIRYMVEGTGKWIRCEILDKDQRQYTRSKLNSNTAYEFHIESINRMGQGNVSIVKGRTEAGSVHKCHDEEREVRKEQDSRLTVHGVMRLTYGEDKVKKEEHWRRALFGLEKEQTATKTYEAGLPSGEEGEEIEEAPCKYVTYQYEYANEAEISEYESDDESYN